MKTFEWVATAAVVVGIALVVDFVVDVTVPPAARALVVIPVGFVLVVAAMTLDLRVTKRRRQAVQRDEG